MDIKSIHFKYNYFLKSQVLQISTLRTFFQNHILKSLKFLGHLSMLLSPRCPYCCSQIYYIYIWLKNLLLHPSKKQKQKTHLKIMMWISMKIALYFCQQCHFVWVIQLPVFTAEQVLAATQLVHAVNTIRIYQGHLLLLILSLKSQGN